MQHIRANVISNREIADGYYELEFILPDTAQAPLPGQFLTVRVTDANVPLLRRPFAFSSWDEPTRRAAIIYQKRGSATAILTGAGEGDELDLLSPLGNSFPDPGVTDDGSQRRPVLLAGGIGMGPMFYLAEDLSRRGHRPLLAVGARSASLLPEISGYSSVETIIATDDGSYPGGYAGNVVAALEAFAAADGSPGTYELYACGPEVMMKAAWDWAQMRDLPCWVSMEQTMGCAVGACMGCVVQVHDDRQYARVCAEGPVFPGGYIKWH
jgi:dihydroorotate dehydrogenase electron transfer subunit